MTHGGGQATWAFIFSNELNRSKHTVTIALHSGEDDDPHEEALVNAHATMMKNPDWRGLWFENNPHINKDFELSINSAAHNDDIDLVDSLLEGVDKEVQQAYNSVKLSYMRHQQVNLLLNSQIKANWTSAGLETCVFVGLGASAIYFLK